MASFQKFIVIGNMVADAELRTTAEGKYVTHFRIAFKERRTNPETIFMSCTAYNSPAETVSKYFHKGDSILVCGGVVKNKYTDKAGVVHETLRLDNVEVAFTVNKGETDRKPTQLQSAPAFADEPDPDFEEISDGEELPF